MTDYRFEGLSARSFEQLVQALALKHLGAGCGVWGDGPDGGRELTFDGPVAYQRRVTWDGPGVVQAKFRQRPQGDDGTWALSQLASELDRIEEYQHRRGARPYYLFVTNVVLSPVHRTGAKDKCFALLDDRAERLGFTDYDIWDYDKLRAFLDDAVDIRRAYRAWITPGDVLADLIEGTQKDKQRVERAISRFLQKQCVADQYARLEQAGTPADERVPIAQVFTDLPLLGPESSPPGTVLGLVTELARERHPSTVGLGEAAPSSRVVVVGGPGQGKTTVGQFACQILRAAMLQDRVDLDIETRPVVEAVGLAADELLDGLPSARRLPFHVPLSTFAERLSSGATSTLIEELAGRVGALSGSSFGIDDMNAVLGQYPILLVLDGLDEVPASSNRDRLMQEVRAFWTDCATVGADVLCVATTRPQGYTDDFDARFYTHVTLAPLDEGSALNYADRLVRSRFGADADRIERALGRLRRAAGQEMTARLMTSPLQVTIMAYLVDTMGQPPRDRWNLFAAYYDVIYKREVERDNELAAVLRDYKVDVDHIHAEVGLALQVISERAGGTEARISLDALEQLVARWLTNREHPPAEVSRLTRLLIDAARQRLVFLVGPEEGEVGFEIRSLQEFMAAKALMTGREAAVSARLAQIAPIDLWRNVLLFAVGKMVVDRDELLVDLHELCLQLEADEGPTFRAAGVGARVALDVLGDGSIRQHPRMRRRFYEVALGVVGRGDVEGAHRLSMLTDEHVDDIAERELATLLRSRRTPGGRGVVAMAAASNAAAERWAPLLASFLPALTGDGVLRALAEGEVDRPALTELLNDALSVAGPATALTAMAPSRGAEVRVRDVRFGVINALSRLIGSRRQRTEWTDGFRIRLDAGPFGIYGNLKSVVRASDDAEQPPIPDDDRWAPLVALVRYDRSPSAQTMAEAAEALAASPDVVSVMRLMRIPWPLSELMAQGRDLLAIAKDARAGRCGDTAAWIELERLWEDAGPLTVSRASEEGPWAPDRGTGWPLHQLRGWMWSSGGEIVAAVDELRALAPRLGSPRVQALLGDLLLVGCRSAIDADRGWTPAWVASVLDDALAAPGRRVWLESVLVEIAATPRSLDAVGTDLLARLMERVRLAARPDSAPIDDVLEAVPALLDRHFQTGDDGWLELVSRCSGAVELVAHSGVGLAGVAGVDELFRVSVDAQRGVEAALLRLIEAHIGLPSEGRHIADVLEAAVSQFDRVAVDKAFGTLPPEGGMDLARVAQTWMAAQRSRIEEIWEGLDLPAGAAEAIAAG